MAELLMGMWTDPQGKKHKVEIAVDEQGRMKTTGTGGGDMSIEEVKSGLESLTDDGRLDVSAVKGAAKADDHGGVVSIGNEAFHIALASALPRKRLVAIIGGNSIAAQNKLNVGIGQQHFAGSMLTANLFSGAVFEQPEIAASTRCDKYGVYGYSGEVSATILSDIDAQWLAPLAAASVTPDLILLPALFENDIAQGIAFATMRQNALQIINKLQLVYPEAVIVLGTPHPSYSYNTQAKVEAYHQVRDWVLSLNNGTTIRSVRNDIYENPSVPGTPLAGHTDVSVHPTVTGSFALAREWAKVLKKIGGAIVPRKTRRSNNAVLAGTGVASGTGVSGTVPTGTSLAGSAQSQQTVEALQPGLRISISGLNGVSPEGGATAFAPINTYSLAGVQAFRIYATIRIVSGAENLRAVYPSVRTWYAGENPGNGFFYAQTIGSSDAPCEYQEGDVLNYISPIFKRADITNASIYLTLLLRAAGLTATVEILEQGYEIVE